MAKKQLVRVLRRTPTGHAVIAGLWRFHESRGVPLFLLLERCWNTGIVIDWFEIYREMRAQGKDAMAPDRCANVLRQEAGLAAAGNEWFERFVREVLVPRLGHIDLWEEARLKLSS